MQLGRVGLWTFQLDLQPASAAREAATELDELGYSTLWLPEAVGREPFVNSALVLSSTERMVVATGIASVWARDAMTMAAGHLTLSEAFPGRFLLGVGVSHQPMVDHVRGHHYEKPLGKMRSYLDEMDRAIYVAPRPPDEPRRVLAALGPKMLQLAAERALGAHPYFVPVEHTAVAREVLGDGPMLCPEQAVVLSTDPDEARAAARQHMGTYLTLPNYTNNLRRLGWTDDDLGDGGSDRLVDAIVAWGDEAAIVERIQAHLAAGADHVCLQVLSSDATVLPMAEWRTLAPAVLSL
ncbi:MAG: LLM class F420-dependent oxidoreductase [Acidimicrobiales bacterium]|nr:LLM class F420-dependent oxidoreductase [Acidimicrobiales bacterium]